MKRSILWLLLTMFVAAYSIAYADTVQIGTGTSTTSYLPLYGYYGYSYTQQIYTQAQIGVSGNIEKIRFYYVSGTITNSRDWVIYMGHTTKTSFSSTTDWEPLANLTQVFTGDVSSLLPLANNWMEITLDTPFNYNNTDNLIIAVDENTSGYASMSWGAFSSASNTGIYYYSDSTNPDPASPPTASNRTGSINRVQLVFPSTSAPLAPTLGSPTNEATGIALDALLTWSSTPGAGDATSYDVYMDTVNGSTLVSNDQAGTSYSPTLAYSTTYHWKVVASNAIGDSPASEVWTFTTIPDPTIVVGPESPWVEDFGTETADWPVLNWSQRSGLYPTPTGTSAQWFRTNWLNGEAGNNAAKINIYGTARYGWLITPPIAIPATGYELKFDLGLTDYYSSNAIEFPEGQADDRFIVAISSTPDMASPTILREWNNSGSEYVYNAISHLGETQIIDLSAYTGTYYVAFYGESTVSVTGEDNDLFVDNVTVRETPSLPIISVSPESWDFGTQLINTTTSQSFTIANDGGAPLSLNSVNVTGTGFALADTFSPISLLPAESTTITVNFSPLTEANYSGNIVISDNRAPTNIPLTGAAIDATIYAGDLPYLENFDAVTVPDLPLGWSTRVTDTSTYGYVKTATSGYSTPNRVTMYNSSDAASDLILITAPIDVALNTLRVKFMAYGGTGYSLQVGTADTAGQDATFTAFETVNPTGAWTQYSVTLSGYVGTDQYLAFKHGQGGTYRTIYIDDVAIEIPAPNPPEPANLVWPLNGITTLLNPLLKWTPSATGEPVTSYKVYMNDSGTFSESDMIYEGTDTQFQTADMGYERTYYWKVLPINAHGSDPTCPTWSFSTPGEYQLAEGFENTVPPAGWSSVGTAWSRSSSYKVEGSYSAYKAGSTSSQYILTTPLLTIIEGSSLQFGALGTSTSASLQIVYSEDGTTWTQIGDTITHTTTYTFTPQVIDLSSLAGNNYYLGFRTGLTSGSTYIDHVVGPELTPVLPGAPTLSAPADAAENQSNYPSFTWTAPTTGGVPSGYNIYMDTVDGSTLYASNVTSPYVPTTALDWEVTYYWTVKAFNNAGTGDAPAARSFTVMSDPTIYTLPYTEGFENGNTNGSTSIANWSQAYVTGAKYWTANSTNTTYNRTPRTGSFNATLGWSASTWMFRPIELTGGVSYDMIAWARQDNADTDYASLTVAYGTEGNAAGMVNTIVPETGLTSGDYQMLSGSFTPATSGVYYIGILGTLPTSTNWYLSLDDITFRESPTGPPDPVTLTNPADEAENMPVGGFNLSWSPALTGGSPSEYAVFMGSTVDVADYAWYNLTETSFDPTQSAVDPITFAYGETWYWTVMASNGDGDADAPNPFSFTIMDDPRILSLPYSQNFDSVTAPALPAAFVKLGTGTVQTQTTNNYSAPNCLYMYSSGTTTISMLVLPDVVLNNVHAKLSFMGRANFTAGGIVQVGYLTDPTDPATFVVIDQVTMASLTYASYEVDLGTINGTMHYALRANPVSPFNSLLIDNLELTEVVPIDMSVVSLTGMPYGFQNTALTHTVTVKNNGSVDVSNYTVYLKSVETRAILGQESFTDPLAANATNAVEFTWTPTSLGAMDIYGEVYVADDAVAANNTSELMSFNVYQEGILFESFEGGVIPANWTVLNADGGTQVWQATTVNPRTGTYAARVRYETSTLDNDDWLITPPLQVTSGTTDNISFWMRSYSATDADPWQVLISTTDTNPASFTMIDEGDGMLANYVQKSYNLDSYGDAVIYLAVRYMGAFDWYLYVDDFVGPPIFTPTTLATPDVTISTVGSNVVLNWDAIPYATSYEVMAADAPEGPYTLAATVTAPTYSSAATSKKFFKVIAKAGATRSITTQALSLEQQLLQDELDKAARSRQ